MSAASILIQPDRTITPVTLPTGGGQDTWTREHLRCRQIDFLDFTMAFGPLRVLMWFDVEARIFPDRGEEACTTNPIASLITHEEHGLDTPIFGRVLLTAAGPGNFTTTDRAAVMKVVMRHEEALAETVRATLAHHIAVLCRV
ncbi:hypothetical protein GCM10022221_68530 [Actinocorallia aurea]